MVLLAEKGEWPLDFTSPGRKSLTLILLSSKLHDVVLDKFDDMSCARSRRSATWAPIEAILKRRLLLIVLEIQKNRNRHVRQGGSP